MYDRGYELVVGLLPALALPIAILLGLSIGLRFLLAHFTGGKP